MVKYLTKGDVVKLHGSKVKLEIFSEEDQDTSKKMHGINAKTKHISFMADEIESITRNGKVIYKDFE